VFLAALVLVLLLGWQSRVRSGRRNAAWLVAAAIVFGLSLGNHALTVLLAPGVGLFVLFVEPELLRRRWRVTLACLAALAPKTRRTRLAPGLPLGLSLRGRRLIAERLLGDASAESAARFVRTLEEWLRSVGPARDFVLLEDIDVESPLWQALRLEAGRGDVAVVYPDKAQPHWSICFPEKANEYWGQFSAKTRETFRRKARKLDHSITCFTEKDRVAEFLEKAHAISTHTWQTKRLGVRIRKSAAERRHYEFLAGQGALRCYVLEHDGRPVAFEVGVQWNGRHVLEVTGYDPAFAQLSPGTVLLYRILQDLIARDTPRVFDFGFGDAEYKRLFGNRQTMSGPVLLVRRGCRPGLAMAIERFRRGVARGVRATSNRLRLGSALRRMYRR